MNLIAFLMTALVTVINPDVVFRDINNKEVSVNALKGKVVFINFWAIWCGPCRQEMKSIHQLQQALKGNDKVVFLLVDVDSNLGKASAYMRNRKFDLPVYAAKSAIPSNFLGGVVPTTVILDKQGRMVTHIEGAADYSKPEVIKGLKELADK